jgi:hypothetical protein
MLAPYKQEVARSSRAPPISAGPLPKQSLASPGNGCSLSSSRRSTTFRGGRHCYRAVAKACPWSLSSASSATGTSASRRSTCGHRRRRIIKPSTAAARPWPQPTRRSGSDRQESPAPAGVAPSVPRQRQPASRCSDAFPRAHRAAKTVNGAAIGSSLSVSNARELDGTLQADLRAREADVLARRVEPGRVRDVRPGLAGEPFERGAHAFGGVEALRDGLA